MSNKIFKQVQFTKPKTNTFDLTHDVKMSGKMGQLMPILNMECVPGDKITLGADTLIRFAPLLAPIMHKINVTIHYFFVPHRILWADWEQFIVGDSGAGEVPFMTYNSAWANTTPSATILADYLGIPPWSSVAAQTATNINAMPFAAYQAIYNEYYRDENLIPEVPYQLESGQNNTNQELRALRLRAWEHDYFTAALPWAQKGSSVDIPLGDVQLKSSWTGTPKFDDGTTIGTGNVTQTGGSIEVNGVAGQAYDPDGSLETAATTINDLRRAFKLQEWLEKNATGGTRYIENILAHFGVRSSDKRLQRPEYITGTKAPVVISEVLNTTGEAGQLPQGNMAGKGISVGFGNKGTYFCEEHGTIMGILSVMPKPAYTQTMPKHFLKRDYLDHYWPSFAHIGEQPVYQNEVYAFRGTDNEDIFGYVPRYSEYKYMPPRVAGEFRTTLDYWHLGRRFAGNPALGSEFIECDPADLSRIFAVTAEDDNLYMQIVNKIKAKRPMPVFGSPML